MITRRQFLGTAALAGAGSCVARAVQVAQAPNPDSAPIHAYSPARSSLRAHAAARGLLVGAAVNTRMLATEPVYARVLADQYNLVVAENAMKWAALRPAPDRYDFTEADRLVAFAEAHQMKVRGHNFVWHEALPAWFAGTVTKENARQVLVDHVTTVGRRYAGRIHSWDVVNEVLDKDSKRPDLLRTGSAWFELLGADYIEIAFRAARAADPSALLTINEYGIEYDGEAPKREALLALVTRLRSAGVPVQAVGVQSHLGAGSPDKLGPAIVDFKDKVKALGLDVFITELDVNDDAVASDDPAVCQAAVAATYRNYVTAMLRQPPVSVVATWGVTNSATWLNTQPSHLARHPNRREQPLLFDADYVPTPAFFALRDAIDSRPVQATGSPSR